MNWTLMKKRIKIIALIVLPLLVLMILGVFILNVGGGILSYFSGILYIATAINHHTGLNIWLARVIAVPFLVAGYYYGLREILFHRKNRKRGYITLIIVWGVICVSMFATQGSFSRKTGEALKYYFRDDHGQIVLRDHGGTDSETGAKLQKVTPDIMKRYRLQQQGVLKVTDETLFDPNTGEPLKRYYRESDGTITLFPLEVQFHPQYGTELDIITSELAVEFSKQTPISPQATAPEETPTPVSLIPEEKKEAVHELASPEEEAPTPVSLVSEEKKEAVHEVTSPEGVEKLNQEYKDRVQGQLDATHAEKESESKQKFDEALDDAEKHQETAPE